MSLWSKLFGPSKTEERVRQLSDRVKEFAQLNEQMSADLNEMRKKETERTSKYDSSEPWVEIVSEQFDPHRGIKLALDWNDAFVAHLKDAGITGVDDDEVVRKWLAYLYADIAIRMEEQELQQSDTVGASTSDYQ